MNSTSDRRFPIIPFDQNRFVPFFGEDECSLEIELLAGGACNSNYLVTRKGKEKFVCRIYTRGTPEMECHIIGIVNGVVPTPSYLWVGDGVSVMSYIQGSHFEPTPSLMRSAGRMIARLSTISFECSGEIQVDGSIKKFDWGSLYSGLSMLLEHPSVSEYLDTANIEYLGGILTDQRGLLDSFDQSHNLVHGDFRPDNILIFKEAIIGILDWEFCHSGNSFMDIGNLLRHFPASWEKYLVKGLKDEGFTLPDDWRYRAYLIDLSSHLDFLTSKKSRAFKLECVSRIEHFIKIHNTEKAVRF